MKFDYDCMRDVLLFLENEITFDEGLNFPDISLSDIMENKLISEKYHITDVAYVVHHLCSCGFLDYIDSSSDNVSDYLINDITYSGHELLAAIHDDTIWNKIKSKLLSIKITSIPAIISCANSILNAAFKE